MMKVWKRNAVVITVVLFVCVGLYLNWSYNREDTEVAELTDVLDSSKVLGESTLVIDEEGDALAADGTTADGEAATDTASDSLDEALNISASTAEEYFASVRLTRQESRDEALELLSDSESSTVSGESDTASAEIEQLVQYSLDEAQIESLVIAKGYSDCVAFMADDGISVVVASPTGGLLDSDVAKITDIVTTQSDYEVADIKIIEVK